jgi:superfamily II DNA/RNA helicase
LTFEDLKLHDYILDGLDAMGFKEPTPIQQQAIPLILEGRDIIASAQTGTGKTAAFILPVLDKILSTAYEARIRVLVIVPTRELAVQIDQQIEGFSYYTDVNSLAVYGGSDAASFTQEKQALTSGAEIIVATPGRFIAHLNLGYVDLSKLDVLVLDEADRMLDMGFHQDIMRIIAKTNPDRQTLLFSATMPKRIVDLSQSILNNPERVSIAISKPAEGVEQQAYLVFDDNKADLAKNIIQQSDFQCIILFASTKQAVRKAFEVMRKAKINAGTISSDLEQKDREEVMLDFRNRKIRVLVATDVVSRGIDIDGIDLVINYDVPQDAEDYVHRVGRTARAERKGRAITLINPTDIRKFNRIEQLIGYEVIKMPNPEGIPAGPDYVVSASSGGSNRRKPFRSKGKSHHGKKDHPKR